MVSAYFSSVTITVESEICNFTYIDQIYVTKHEVLEAFAQCNFASYQTTSYILNRLS